MKRIEVETKYTWNTDDILSGKEEFLNRYNALKSQLDFSSFKGNLNSNEVILNCYNKLYDLYGELEVLSVYAMMKCDENGSDADALEMTSLIDSVSVKFSAETSFISPELSKLGVDKLKELLKDARFDDYALDITRLIENLPHVLGEEAENVLSLGGSVYGGYRDAFFAIDNVDFNFPSITVDGKKVKVTHATYSKLLQNPNETVRKKAFKAYYKAYKQILNTITALYNGNVSKNVFLSRAKKFNSSLERALHNEEVDKSVYLNLLKQTNDALPVLHEYVKERKRLLNKTLYMYDLYVPLVEDADLKLSYEDAFSLVLEGLKPLGEDYKALLLKAKNERWIDVYETECKRSGAYSVCVHNLKHPYVLLNHTETTHDVFTIAHELGHAMHSHFSKNSQPRTKSDYTIFVAEVASTVNEILLVKHLIKNSKDDKVKKYFLSYYLDTIRTTLFRQTMFAEFEEKAHSLAENGEPLTKERLNSIYLELNKKYYGPSVISNEEIAYEWARIPHFYSAFYVYKYATGIISAITIAEKILSGEKGAVENYFKFLSSGASDKPTELLKITGVDLNSNEAFELAFKSFENALNQFKQLN